MKKCLFSLASLMFVGLIANAQKVEFEAPKTPGAYRLYAYVYDGNGNAAHANIPFFVK